MYRSMLAFALFVILSGMAWGQYPFEWHSSRTNAGPVTNLGRYHGFGYGPGYHNVYSRPSATRWYSRPPIAKPGIDITGSESRRLDPSRVDLSRYQSILYPSPSTAVSARSNSLR